MGIRSDAVFRYMMKSILIGGLAGAGLVAAIVGTDAFGIAAMLETASSRAVLLTYFLALSVLKGGLLGFAIGLAALGWRSRQPATIRLRRPVRTAFEPARAGLPGRRRDLAQERRR